MSERAPFGTEGAPLGSPDTEQKCETQIQGMSGLRQRSSRRRDIETAGHMRPRTHNEISEADDNPGTLSAHPGTPLGSVNPGGEQPESTGADNEGTWPGSDFELKTVLPGSVYLWACGERDDGDQKGPPEISRPEVCAAWVVLIVSAEAIQSTRCADCVAVRQNRFGS